MQLPQQGTILGHERGFVGIIVYDTALQTGSGYGKVNGVELHLRSSMQFLNKRQDSICQSVSLTYRRHGLFSIESVALGSETQHLRQ